MSYQYIFLISLTQSTSLKFCFCILDFSAVDTNLFSLNSMNFSHRRKQILLSIKNPQKIISNQDIFFFKWSDWKPAQKPALRKTSKQTSFHFISLTLSHNKLTWSKLSPSPILTNSPPKICRKLMVRNGRLE